MTAIEKVTKKALGNTCASDNCSPVSKDSPIPTIEKVTKKALESNTACGPGCCTPMDCNPMD